MTRLFICCCLFAPAPAPRLALPEYRPACFPHFVACNWRTEYYIGTDEVELSEITRLRAVLRLVEVRHEGGWVRTIRFAFAE